MQWQLWAATCAAGLFLVNPLVSTIMIFFLRSSGKIKVKMQAPVQRKTLPGKLSRGCSDLKHGIYSLSIYLDTSILRF